MKIIFLFLKSINKKIKIGSNIYLCYFHFYIYLFYYIYKTNIYKILYKLI